MRLSVATKFTLLSPVFHALCKRCLNYLSLLPLPFLTSLLLDLRSAKWSSIPLDPRRHSVSTCAFGFSGTVYFSWSGYEIRWYLENIRVKVFLCFLPFVEHDPDKCSSIRWKPAGRGPVRSLGAFSVWQLAAGLPGWPACIIPWARPCSQPAAGSRGQGWAVRSVRSSPVAPPSLASSVHDIKKYISRVLCYWAAASLGLLISQARQTTGKPTGSDV